MYGALIGTGRMLPPDFDPFLGQYDDGTFWVNSESGAGGGNPRGFLNGGSFFGSVFSNSGAGNLGFGSTNFSGDFLQPDDPRTLIQSNSFTTPANPGGYMGGTISVPTAPDNRIPVIGNLPFLQQTPTNPPIQTTAGTGGVNATATSNPNISINIGGGGQNSGGGLLENLLGFTGNSGGGFRLPSIIPIPIPSGGNTPAPNINIPAQTFTNPASSPEFASTLTRVLDQSNQQFERVADIFARQFSPLSGVSSTPQSGGIIVSPGAQVVETSGGVNPLFAVVAIALIGAVVWGVTRYA